MWELILSLALKILGLTMDKVASNNAAKKAYLEFVDRLGELGVIQVKLNAKDMAQVEELRRLRAEANKPVPPAA